MGNMFQFPASTPSHYSYQSCRATLAKLNAQFSDHRKKLGYWVVLASTGSAIKFQNVDWTKSKVPGRIASYPPKQIHQHQLEYKQEPQSKPKSQLHQQQSLQQPQMNKPTQDKSLTWYDMHVTLDEVYRMYEILSNFTQGNAKTTPGNQPASTPTPQHDSPQQNGQKQNLNECCICLENIPSMVLPCSHSFCSSCTQKYIIDKEEHKCPNCRRQFTGSKETLAKSIYNLVDKEGQEQLWKDVAKMIGDCLKQRNRRVMERIYQQSHSPPASKKQQLSMKN